MGCRARAGGLQRESEARRVDHLAAAAVSQVLGAERQGNRLVGEVSRVNDDQTDNRFHEPMGRSPRSRRMKPPLHLLVTDYGHYYPFASDAM